MKLDNLADPAQDAEKEAADPKGLSPMTRRSDRAKQDVDYIGLIRGNGRAGEVDLSGLGQLSGITLNPIGTKDLQKSRSKISGGGDAQLAKKSNLPDTLKKVEDILDKLKKSSNAPLFNKPIGK